MPEETFLFPGEEGYDASQYDAPGTTLSASTGRRDPGSVFGSGLLNFIDTGTKGAAGILNALGGKQQPKPAKQAASPNWLIIAVAGVVALVLVLLVARK